MPVGLRTRTNEVIADTMTKAGIRWYALRGEAIAKLMTTAGQADPYSVYTSMRQRGDILRESRFGVWIVTNYELVGQALRDPRFGVDNRVLDGYTAPPEGELQDHEMILRMDPPGHTRIRRLVGAAFVPRAIATLRPTVEKISAELLDGVDADGFDLIGDYAVPLTVRVICDLLGVPSADWRQFREWGDPATNTLSLTVSRVDQRLATEAMNQLTAYFTALIERRRSEPADDLLSLMIAAEEEGDRLTDRELLANLVLLLLAGFETTVNLIGNAVVALTAAEYRSQWDAIAADPDGHVGNAVEEVLRYDSPVQFTGRNVKEDVELGDHVIPKGKELLVLLAGANNDPAVFAEPRRLDIERDNAKAHLSFSSGPHHCLGASLARMEGDVALRDLTGRFPRLRVGARPTRRPNALLRGYKSIPVTAH